MITNDHKSQKSSQERGMTGFLSISIYRKDLASQFRYWTFSPEVTPSSGTPLPDPGVRADFIQVVYKMTFWPCLRRQRQNYGCQMHFINQTPLQFPSIPNIFKNDHKSQKSSSERGMTGFLSISFYRKDLASQFRYWTFSPEVTPSSGTPLPDPGVRADFIQVVYKMTFWPCLRRQRQNYGCQMHFINQTPLQFPSIPNIFKNDHKSQKSSSERGMTGFLSISFYRKDLASQFRYWTFSPEVTPSSGTPLPDPGVRADFIQVVYKMTFWPCLRRQRQNYGCQMYFINQTPLQVPSIPNIFKNDHKSQKSSSERGMTGFLSISFYRKDLASQFRYWTFSPEVTPIVLAHLCQILASEQISFKLLIKWLSDHVCVDKDRITDAKCIL